MSNIQLMFYFTLFLLNIFALLHVKQPIYIQIQIYRRFSGTLFLEPNYAWIYNKEQHTTTLLFNISWTTRLVSITKYPNTNASWLYLSICVVLPNVFIHIVFTSESFFRIKWPLIYSIKPFRIFRAKVVLITLYQLI